MDKGLRECLDKHGAKPLDPKVLKDYKTMMETVIPKIIEDIKRRERYAMELRYRPYLPPTIDDREK